MPTYDLTVLGLGVNVKSSYYRTTGISMRPTRTKNKKNKKNKKTEKTTTPTRAMSTTATLMTTETYLYWLEFSGRVEELVVRLLSVSSHRPLLWKPFQKSRQTLAGHDGVHPARVAVNAHIYRAIRAEPASQFVRIDARYD